MSGRFRSRRVILRVNGTVILEASGMVSGMAADLLCLPQIPRDSCPPPPACSLGFKLSTVASRPVDFYPSPFLEHRKFWG